MILSLVDKEGNPSAARLYVRVTQDSISAVADGAMEQAQTSAKFPQALDTHVYDALSDQQGLVTTLGFVMKLIKPLIKIGDEISKVCSLVFCNRSELMIFRKIHPFVTLAWAVLSAGMKASYILLLSTLCFMSSI